MASGILGQSAPSAGINSLIYTVPTDTVAYANLNVVNRGAADAVVRIALSATSTPTTAEWVEYDTVIAAYGVLERTGFALQAGKKVVAFCDTADTSVAVYGVEESTT
tara:strand:+ start:185 stop:505 length:321 start_codon:yes stop_codon:yes gene_type:complete